MEKTFMKSTSGKTVIVREIAYDVLGLPMPNSRTGVIRPKEGSDLDAIISHLEAGDVKFEFGPVQNKDNGLYEMVREGVVVAATEPLVETTN